MNLEGVCRLGPVGPKRAFELQEVGGLDLYGGKQAQGDLCLTPCLHSLQEVDPLPRKTVRHNGTRQR